MPSAVTQAALDDGPSGAIIQMPEQASIALSQDNVANTLNHLESYTIYRSYLPYYSILLNFDIF